MDLALLNDSKDHFVNNVFIDVNLQIQLLVRDVVGDYRVQLNLRLIGDCCLVVEVFSVEDVVEVIEDVDHVVTVGRHDELDLDTIHVHQFLAVVHHDIPVFQIRSGKKKGSVSWQDMNHQISPNLSNADRRSGTELRANRDTVSKTKVTRVLGRSQLPSHAS